MTSANHQPEHGRYNPSRKEREQSQLKAYTQELLAFGNYYVHTVPSEIDFNRLVETEVLLNALFIMSRDFSFDEKLIRKIEERLGKISSLVQEIKSGHTRFTANAFVEIKTSGRELVEIAELIEKYTD